MHEGYRVRTWAHQNGYTLQRLADELDYPLPTLAEALDNNLIGPGLAKALRIKFGLRVISTRATVGQAEDQRASDRNTSVPPLKTGDGTDQATFHAHVAALKLLLDKSPWRHR